MNPGRQTGSGWYDGERRAPRRKRVVLADRRGVREVPRTVMEIDEQSSLGEALVTNLVRAQLRTSLWLAALTVVVLFGLPVLFWSVPGLALVTVWGVPLTWLVLGVAPFPFILLVGYLSTRGAERHEREFLDVVDRQAARREAERTPST